MARRRGRPVQGARPHLRPGGRGLLQLHRRGPHLRVHVPPRLGPPPPRPLPPGRVEEFINARTLSALDLRD